MTEHLPECLVPDFDKSLWICICNQLRACEARVSAFYSAEIERQGAQWEKSCRQFYRSGSDDGRELALDAAREAVKHLQHSDDCYYAEGVLCHCEIKRVITAIDALREEKP